MHSLSDFQEAFQRYLRDHRFAQEPRNLYEPIDYIMGLGGKRLRPILALIGYSLFRDEPAEASPIAMAVEVFHNFTLVHDDIMDAAPLRRGQPTVHHRYGINAGILSGDAMLITAYRYLEKTPEHEALPALLQTFNEVALEVCEGQQYDMDFETRQDVSIPEYLRMIELKTAALIGGSLELGAIAAGAGRSDRENLRNFGRQIGIAFQLQDDILDTFGDPDKVGKKPGGDIAQNKKTFLVLKALEIADAPTHAQLMGYLSTKPEDEAGKIAAVTQILRRLGIPELAEAAKQQYQDEAFRCLDAVQGQAARKALLRELSLGLMGRQS
jgi:geranylgeranyl diphosphate synthase, type II